MITIFYNTGEEGPSLQHDVPTKEAGLDWIEDMCAQHPAFCVTGAAIHRITTSYGAACAPLPLRLS